jgi:hypothetical protein
MEQTAVERSQLKNPKAATSPSKQKKAAEGS